MQSNPDPEGGAGSAQSITQPAKLMRLVDMTRQVLEELHHGGLDRAARERVHTSHREALHELREVLPDANRQELDALLAPLERASTPEAGFGDDREGGGTPSGAELRLAEAQLLGWLEGLLKGFEADQAVRRADAQLQQIQEASDNAARGDGDPPQEGRGGYR